MLRCDNITVKRGNRAVLRQLHFDLQAAELVAVIGPNGSGKSTLLKALTGELALARGTVELNGLSLATQMQRPQDIARWRAVLPQQSELAFNFPVIDVVMMGRSPHLARVEQARNLEICEAALEQVDCLALKDRRYQHLSGGERQRVHLARVLAQLHEGLHSDGPALLFLDEPTANLDLKHQIQILHLARQCADRGAAVFLVLHDLQQARAYADRVLMLKAGRSVAFGKAASVLSAKRIERVFDIPVEWVQHEADALLKIKNPKLNTTNTTT
ncbi:MAG TPA: heme ABC transporter ATP-binding protein [Opitutae bacterium]|nr:heme ABC transporter ATP-binding protein [Puniceicoccaceae bacterium]HBR94258.1 heme ABC transporter ATP-binding protein [Opitutae bacterium]|tara:strand:+ start:7203 stop:8018 length:816 start_codon:yes stop_codon:yes gene_type:complete